MKHAIVTGVDITALSIIIGAAANILPAVAALLGVVWYGILIYDRIKYGHKTKDQDE